MKTTKEPTPAVEQTEIDKLAAALVTIIQSPDTPADLYDAVSTWITSATNIEDSNGDSLVHRWTYHPDTVRACVSWSIEDQHRKEDEAAIVDNARKKRSQQPHRSESNA